MSNLIIDISWMNHTYQCPGLIGIPAGLKVMWIESVKSTQV